MRCRSCAGTTTKVRLRCELRRPVSARAHRPGTPASWSPQVPRTPLHRVGLAASRSNRGPVPGSASIRAICACISGDKFCHRCGGAAGSRLILAAGISGGATTWKGLQAYRESPLSEFETIAFGSLDHRVATSPGRPTWRAPRRAAVRQPAGARAERGDSRGAPPAPRLGCGVGPAQRLQCQDRVADVGGENELP
jgi:hypothetical protein